MAKPRSEADGSPRKVIPLDERRLLPLHRRGDTRAFVELISRYRAPVYGYLVRCGVPAATRDDLFQDVFTKIHAAAATYQPDRALEPWLFTIVANTVRSYYRKTRVEKLVFGEHDPGVHAPSRAPNASDTAESRETAAWLEGAIATLPLAQREVLILSCVQGMEHKEIAIALDVPINTIKTHLRRARLALTRNLAQRNARIAREVSR